MQKGVFMILHAKSTSTYFIVTYKEKKKRNEHQSASASAPPKKKLTNSSAAVGWMATQLSKSFFVAPILTATPKPTIGREGE